MENEPIIITERFCGPPESGNGGYVCGRLAAYIDGPAAVRLRIPPPMNAPLKARQSEAGFTLHHHDEQDVLVAEAKPVELSLEVPDPPSFAAAETAAQGFTGFKKHWFPGCFVCGPDREVRDGLRIFAGSIGQPGMVAAPWIPDTSLADAEQNIKPEFIWSALDCPGAFAVRVPTGNAIVLGELAASLSGTLRAEDPCVVIGWSIHDEGRKHITGTAVFDSSGTCKGIARGTWIEIADPQGS